MIFLLFLLFFLFSRIRRSAPRRPEDPPDWRFSSRLGPRATGIKFAGSIPACGSLSQMCECACRAFTHFVNRLDFPLWGRTVVDVPTVRTLNQLETSQLERPRYFQIARKSRNIYQQLTGPASLALISERGASILAHFSPSDSGLEMALKVGCH